MKDANMSLTNIQSIPERSWLRVKNKTARQVIINSQLCAEIYSRVLVREVRRIVRKFIVFVDIGKGGQMSAWSLESASKQPRTLYARILRKSILMKVCSIRFVSKKMRTLWWPKSYALLDSDRWIRVSISYFPRRVRHFCSSPGLPARRPLSLLFTLLHVLLLFFSPGRCSRTVFSLVNCSQERSH